MRKGMFFTVLLIATGLFTACNAQKVTPTKTTQKAFTKAYPQVKNPTWEKENGNFEGNWDVSGKDHSALFTPQGKFVGSETEIEPSKLPLRAQKYIAKIGDEIDEASLNKDAQGTTTYEADVEGSTYLFDSKGKFIKKSTSEEVEQGEKGEKNEAYEEGEEND